MANILVIVPPLTGHINPTIAVGQELLDRGHTVSWIGYKESLNNALLPHMHAHYLTEGLTLEWLRGLHEGRSKRGIAAFQFLWEDVFIPLAQQSFHEVYSLLTKLQPDLCIIDQQMLSGSLAARKLSLPWITSATTSATVVKALDQLPKIKEWLRQHLHTLQLQFDVSPIDEPDLSPRGVCIFSSRQLTQGINPTLNFPDYFHFVGPALSIKRNPISFPWHRLNPTMTKIFISLGTVNADRGARFYNVVLDAFREEEYQVIISAPLHFFPDPPSHFIVCERVPQLELLKQIDLVICHGGHNTTCETLAEGIPLLIAPIKDDQPIIAEQVVACGAGLRLKFGRVKAKVLRDKTQQILQTPSFKEAARHIQLEFSEVDGSVKAANLIDSILV